MLRRLARAAFQLVLAAALPAAAAAQTVAQPVPRGDRWQLRRAGGEYLYDVRPVGTRGDSLVIVRLDSMAVPPMTIALADLEEVRLVQPSLLVFGAGAPENPFGELGGAGDVIFPLAGAEMVERRRMVAEALSSAAAAATAAARRAP